MAVQFEKEKDLYIGAKGFQSSIFLIQVQARLAAKNRTFAPRSESAFEGALTEGVQAVIIKDEDLLEGVITVRYGNGEEEKHPEKEVEEFVITEMTGNIILFCEEDDADEEETEFDD